MSDTERWLPVIGYEGQYEVSDLGRVRSLDRILQTRAGWSRFYSGRVLQQNPRSGYMVVNLCPPVSGQSHSVHRLVLEAFVGPCPDGMECCHDNDIKSDNRLSNLTWGTKSKNRYDRVRNGNDPHRLRTTCPRGHKLEAPNLSAASMARRGHRRCLACERAHANSANARRKGLEFDFKRASDEHYAKIMAGTGAVYQGNRTQCPRGHPLEGTNLVPSKAARGERNCLSCDRAHAQARAAKRRGEETEFDFKAAADRNYQDIMEARPLTA